MINLLLEKVIRCAQMSVDCLRGVETGDSRIHILECATEIITLHLPQITPTSVS